MMRQIDQATLAALKAAVRNFAEARFQLAILDGDAPGIVYGGLDPKGTYADVLRSTTSYDEGTIDDVSTIARDTFREKWAEMEELHSAISTLGRPA